MDIWWKSQGGGVGRAVQEVKSQGFTTQGVFFLRNPRTAVHAQVVCTSFHLRVVSLVKFNIGHHNWLKPNHGHLQRDFHTSNTRVTVAAFRAAVSQINAIAHFLTQVSRIVWDCVHANVFFFFKQQRCCVCRRHSVENVLGHCTTNRRSRLGSLPRDHQQMNHDHRSTFQATACPAAAHGRDIVRACHRKFPHHRTLRLRSSRRHGRRIPRYSPIFSHDCAYDPENC